MLPNMMVWPEEGRCNMHDSPILDAGVRLASFNSRHPPIPPAPHLPHLTKFARTDALDQDEISIKLVPSAPIHITARLSSMPADSLLVGLNTITKSTLFIYIRRFFLYIVIIGVVITSNIVKVVLVSAAWRLQDRAVLGGWSVRNPVHLPVLAESRRQHRI
jgi:hypothetical protein